MASYPGAAYLQGQPLPGPPPGPPPGPSRQASHASQYSNNSYGAPSPYQEGSAHNQAPTSAPQPFLHFQPQPNGQQLPPIPQHRPLSNSQMRHHSYSQPQQIPPGYLGPPGYLHPQHASAPQQSWMPPSGPNTPGSYPFGEPGYSQHPGLDPRRYSASSHGSYHSTHSKGRKGRYSDDSGFSDDETWDSMYDSEEEERRRRKKERRKRREEEASKSKRKRDRPTLGDSVFAVFDGFKGAFSSTDAKH
ncbi:hypothetical protein BDZ85DRAFT_135299 [Elsinoe ampelina]|uniref:Uncharacterized protein n=1 Tax=Elsinoe ampelina TaxID=302913 RepID=A0A6A6G8R5_9PEZI|nr:hypothetical protein BDZ85DRAFT_135299 [Elsinoe ampelina]